MDPAWRGLIILLFCIILFVTEKFTMATTAILGCVLMVLFGVAKFSSVFGQFSSSSIILLVSMMIMGQALYDTGATDVIIKNLLKASKGNERCLLVLCTLSVSLISAFLSNVATLMIFLTLFLNSDDIDSSIDRRNFILPLGMASVVGGTATLIGSAPQLATQNYLEVAGYRSFGFFDFSYVGLALITLLTLYVGFIGYPLGKKIWKKVPKVNQVKKVEETTKPQSKKILMLIIFFMTVVFMVLQPFPMAVIAVCGALVSIISGCISAQKAIHSVYWSSVLKLAGCLGILNAINESGGNEKIGQLFLSLIGENITPHLLLILVIILTQLLSEFMTNSAALLIVLPSALSVCMQCNFQVYGFAMAITMASCTALCCPLSNTPLTIVSTYGYRFSDFLKYNICWDVLADIVIFLVTPIFFPLV